MVDENKLLIHIVADDEPIRDSTGLLLEALGHGALTFPSAMDYLESGMAGAADAMLLDFHMSRISGFELLELLRARKIGTAAVIMTANGVHLASRLMETTNFSILLKPFAEGDLLAKIKEARANRAGR